VFWIIDKIMDWIRPKPARDPTLSRLVSDYEIKRQKLASPTNISDDSHTFIKQSANNDQEITGYGQEERQQQGS